MAKKIVNRIKLQIVAGKATPAQPVGPALGQAGVNIMMFCKEFNARTQPLAAEGLIIPTEITVYADRTFTFVCKSPPASQLIMKAVGITKGSPEPNKVKVGSISRDQLREIAERKIKELNTRDIDAAIRMIEGTCRSMGVTVRD